MHNEVRLSFATLFKADYVLRRAWMEIGKFFSRAKKHLVLVCGSKSTQFKCWYLVNVRVVEIDLVLLSEHRNCLGFKMGVAINLISALGWKFGCYLCYDQNCFFVLS